MNLDNDLLQYVAGGSLRWWPIDDRSSSISTRTIPTGNNMKLDITENITVDGVVEQNEQTGEWFSVASGNR